MTNNKPHFPPGPWMDEPDRVDGESYGFPTLILRNRVGALCGYVGVPSGHPWYEQGYDAINVDVHGGLTYSHHCAGRICHQAKAGEPDHVWWVGFDCAHACDLSPLLDYQRSMRSEETYRDLAYVTAEVEKLAQQARDVDVEN